MTQARPGGLWVYLLVTFGLAWLIELGPVRSLGLTSGDIRVMLLMVAVMFTPAVGSVAARLYERAGFGDAGLRWGRGRFHLVAWLLPFALGLAATVFTVLLGLGQLDLSGQAMLERLPEAQRAAAAAQLAAVGAWLPLAVILGTLTQGVLITSIPAFGEELGWRGYLQVRLRALGRLRAMALTGAIWGVWHIPVILQGHNYPGHPYLGSALMVVWCVLLAIIFGWLFEAARSVIAPSIAHASLNSPSASLGMFVAGVDPALGNITGVVGIVLCGLVVAWLWLSGRLRDEETPTGAERMGPAPVLSGPPS